MNYKIETADDAMNFIINFLRNRLQNPLRNNGSEAKQFDLASYEIIPEIYQDKNYSGSFHTENALILDALWDLTRRGILRQTPRNDTSTQFTSIPFFRYYSFTESGKKWLQNTEERFIFGSHSNYANILKPFKEKLGESFYIRASEAASCYQFNLYIATCAMAGTAAECILGQLLSIKRGDTEMVSIFKNPNGRNKAIDNLVGSEHKIRDRIKSFMDKLSSWRNDSVHVGEAYFEGFHAYESLASLLELARYSFNNFEKITGRT